jgi:hypothetical protein
MKSITRFTKNIRGNECLNCKTPISEGDNFCSQCGQVNDINRLSVKQYISVYLEDFYSFDNRFLKTVIPLIFKPGFVTKEYINGQRIKYVNPFQLYLHITILFFLVVGVFSKIDEYKSLDGSSSSIISEINLDQGKAALDSIKSETLKELRQNNVQLDSSTLLLIDNGLNTLSTNKDSLQSEYKNQTERQASSLNSFIDSILASTEILSTLKNDHISLSEKDSTMKGVLGLIGERAEILSDNDKHMNLNSASAASMIWEEISIKGNLEKIGIKHLDSIFDAKEIAYEIPLDMIYRANRNQNELNKIQSFIDYQKDHPDESAAISLEKLGFEASYWNAFLFSKSKEWGDAFGDEHYWEEFIDRVLSRISVALFFLLPLFTMIVSLLYIRRKFNYTENLVFVFHVQTVFFLLLLVFMIVNRIADSNVGILIFLLTFMIYLYLAMRKFYGQGWFKTLIKYILLNSAFMVFAIIGGLIISFLAFLI